MQFLQNFYMLRRLFLLVLSKETLPIVFDIIKRSFSFGFTYVRGLLFILFIDACLTDDEPLWEPIEWSLVQT